MKKTLSLFLSLLLLLGLIPTAFATEELEPVVLHVLVTGDQERNSLDDEVGQMIWEELKIEIQFIPFNESMYEKAQMMLAANNWDNLDMVNTAMNEITSQYIAADAFVNLDDYRELMPNFYEDVYKRQILGAAMRMLNRNKRRRSPPDSLPIVEYCMSAVNKKRSIIWVAENVPSLVLTSEATS